MKEFEYHVEPRILDEEALNDLGKEGWELLVAQPGGKWVFKRKY